MTASKVSIIAAVSRAMSAPPGTIQGTTPTPAGNTTTHSVMAFHSTRVKARDSRGSTKVMATTLLGWAW